jgi:anti-anti-sigma factor
MIITTESVGNVVTLKLDGRFATEQCRQFLKEMTLQLHTNAKSLVIDFEKIVYMDSSALGALLMIREKANALGKVISLLHCKGDVKTVLGIANFHKLFTIS